MLKLSLSLAEVMGLMHLFNFDSYKAGHFEQYPEGIEEIVAYGEFRKAFPGLEDDRIVWYGMRHIVEHWLEKQWDHEQLAYLDYFMSTQNAGSTPYPYPREQFVKFINENNGYFPVQVDALPEGTVVYPHTTVYRIKAKAPYAELVTFLETIISHTWYQTTVATLSRHARSIIEDAFQKSVDQNAWWKLESRLNDFGFRGCTCVEQAMLGGAAHLLNFHGSDTVAAAFYAQFHLNNGIPVGDSIPATEHSVMTSYPTVDGKEIEAVKFMINKYGGGVFATVADSYDYDRFLNEIVWEVAPLMKSKGGFWVVRPDSGDPVKCVVDALYALDRAFGTTLNSKGFKVINGAGVIQGDGIDIHTIKAILEAVLAEGFSAENVAFGMGAGLLQKVNRDTLSLATKVCYIVYKNGVRQEVWKHPKTDTKKFSFPGVTQVNMVSDLKGHVYPQTYPRTAHWEDTRNETDLLTPVYAMGPVIKVWPSFDYLRGHITVQHARMPARGTGISTQLADKIAAMQVA
jgi:nicotinic acid phosphoribosyltransferase